MFEIGATLREARERRQLTYEQVEAEIKIRAKYLRALEEEEFDSLPSGTYVRGFLRAYASYLGLDGRLFVDEYASRFGTRHDDELFRRRRERPMTQRKDSSSAVLVALIAVVAIGVLFFVAWRFGPGEATPPPISVQTVTTGAESGPNANPSIVTATTTVTTTTERRGSDVPQPVNLRIDVTQAKTWVKITRLSTGKVIAQKEVPAGEYIGSTALRDMQGFAIETAIPGNLSVSANGHTFTLEGKGPWIVTADGEATYVLPGPIPKPVKTEQK